jgi:general secretion pathway protein C
MNKVSKHAIVTLLYSIVVAKLLALLLLFILPKSGVERVEEHSDALYSKFNVQKAFALHDAKKSAVSHQTQIKPEYKLDDLQLVGVFIAKENTFIIAQDKKKENLFIDKNERYKGFKLIAVEPTRAIFNKNGKNYFIDLVADKMVEKQINESVRPANSTKKIELPGYRSDPARESVKFVKKAEVVKYKNDYSAVVKNIGFQDVIENRKLKGFKVTKIKRGSLFEKFGLRVGDIVTAINNEQIKSYSQVMNTYKNIDKIDSLKLTITRDNQEKELEYEVY